MAKTRAQRTWDYVNQNPPSPITFELVEQAEVDYTEYLIREALKQPKIENQPITGTEWERFNSGAGPDDEGYEDEYDHDKDEEMFGGE